MAYFYEIVGLGTVFKKEPRLSVAGKSEQTGALEMFAGDDTWVPLADVDLPDQPTHSGYVPEGRADLREPLHRLGRRLDGVTPHQRCRIVNREELPPVGELSQIVDIGEQVVDTTGCFFGLFCEIFDLAGDHLEAVTSFARPGGFDRCVERQQVRLVGDI